MQAKYPACIIQAWFLCHGDYQCLQIYRQYYWSKQTKGHMKAMRRILKQSEYYYIGTERFLLLVRNIPSSVLNFLPSGDRFYNQEQVNNQNKGNRVRCRHAKKDGKRSRKNNGPKEIIRINPTPQRKHSTESSHPTSDPPWSFPTQSPTSAVRRRGSS